MKKERSSGMEVLRQAAREMGEIGAGIRPAAQPVSVRDGCVSHVSMRVVHEAALAHPAGLATVQQ